MGISVTELSNKVFCWERRVLKQDMRAGKDDRKSRGPRSRRHIRSYRIHKDNSLSLDKYPSDLGKTPQASPAGLHCLQRPLEQKLLVLSSFGLKKAQWKDFGTCLKASCSWQSGWRHAKRPLQDAPATPGWMWIFVKNIIPHSPPSCGPQLLLSFH